MGLYALKLANTLWNDGGVVKVSEPDVTARWAWRLAAKAGCNPGGNIGGGPEEEGPGGAGPSPTPPLPLMAAAAKAAAAACLKAAGLGKPGRPIGEWPAGGGAPTSFAAPAVGRRGLPGPSKGLLPLAAAAAAM